MKPFTFIAGFSLSPHRSFSNSWNSSNYALLLILQFLQSVFHAGSVLALLLAFSRLLSWWPISYLVHSTKIWTKYSNWSLIGNALSRKTTWHIVKILIPVYHSVMLLSHDQSGSIFISRPGFVVWLPRCIIPILYFLISLSLPVCKAWSFSL